MNEETVMPDSELMEMLSGVESSTAAIRGGARGIEATIPQGARPWLARPRTLLQFRTRKSATFASLQIAREGYTVVAGQRSIVVEAPWILVAALAGRMGLGTEATAIRWNLGRRLSLPLPER